MCLDYSINTSVLSKCTIYLIYITDVQETYIFCIKIINFQEIKLCIKTISVYLKMYYINRNML